MYYSKFVGFSDHDSILALKKNFESLKCFSNDTPKLSIPTGTVWEEGVELSGTTEVVWLHNY